MVMDAKGCPTCVAFNGKKNYTPTGLDRQTGCLECLQPMYAPATKECAITHSVLSEMRVGLVGLF